MSNSSPKHRADGPARPGPQGATTTGKQPTATASETGVVSKGGTVRTASAHPKRRWPRRTLVIINVVVFLGLAVVGSAYGYVRYRLDNIRTLPGNDLTGQGGNLGGGPGGTSAGGGGQPMNILLIGNETRAGLTPSEQQWLGSSLTYSGSEADIMMVLHLDPAHHAASILSIPRDLFAPMPAGSPVGTFQKLDAALNDGAEGPDNLSEAVQEDLGIPVNGFIELNFNGFINSVDALGGINVYFPERVYDAESLLYITEPGCHHLNGRSALSLVRARHLQYDPPGDDAYHTDWPQEPESDLARIVRTHVFIKLVAAKAKSDYTDPLAINNFLSAVLEQMTVDAKLRNQLPSLVLAYLHTDIAAVPELTLPTSGVPGYYYYDGDAMGDVVFPVEPVDENVIKQWDPGALLASARPSSVQVVSIADDYEAAVNAGQALSGDGFKVTSETTGPVPASTSETLVLYHKYSLARALDVMKYLSGSVMLQEDSSVPAGQVVVDLGSTVAVRSAPATTERPTSSTTSTGAPVASSSAPTTTLSSGPGGAQGPAAGQSAPSSTHTGSTTTTSVPTPSGTSASASRDQLEPWDPRACPPGSKVIKGT